VVALAVVLLAGCEPNRFVGGWIPYWTASSGSATIAHDDAAAMFGEVSLFWFGTASNGTVTRLGSASSVSSAANTVRNQGLPLIPTIFDTSDAPVMRDILADPARRAAHQNAIVDLVMSNDYDGIDLDYETFAFGHPRSEWASITPLWVTFVEDLSRLLHARGKLLYVTVPPVWTTDGTANGTVQGYTLYAQEQIIDDVDRLRFMVYDWSLSSPGPIGPISWVNSVIGYSNRTLPAEARSKLQLGVPAYGRHWRTQRNATEVCPDGALGRQSVQMKDAAALAASQNRSPTRHESGEMTFSWAEVRTGRRTAALPPPPWPPWPPVVIDDVPAVGDTPGALKPAVRLAPPSEPVTCTVQHTVFYPDPFSVTQRAQAALNAGWSGIIVWALGYEVPEVYQSLAGISPARANGLPRGALDALTVTGTSIRSTGFAVHPEFDVPLAVRLRLTGPRTADVTITANVSRSGMPAGTGAYHGFDRTFGSLPAGTYTVCASFTVWDGTVTNLPCRSVTLTG
jgi:spore germination protein YaaH